MARFQEHHHWPLEDGFHILGRLLAFMGNEKLLKFGLWENLEIELPNRDLPFNRLDCPELPLATLTKLRQLTWTGHPKQILNSWLPLTPSLLQNLEILTITCDITSYDFAYILRQVNRLKTFSLKHIRRDSMSMSVTPLIKRHSRQRYPVTTLKNLTVVSDEDICIVFDQFYFPSLLSLTLGLRYPAFQSNFHDLESFDWGALKRFKFRSDLWNVDATNFDILLSSGAEFSHHYGGHTVSWQTTLPKATHMSKLKVAIVAAACVLNVGLLIASTIWLYQRNGHCSFSNLEAESNAEFGLNAGQNDRESQDEDDGSTETTISNSPDSRALILDDQSHRDDFDSELEIGSLLAMTGSEAVDQPGLYAGRRSLRSHPHQTVEAAAVNHIPNSVDIHNQSTPVSAKFHFEESYTIGMTLVAHASHDEQRKTAIVLQSLAQTGHALTVVAKYGAITWTRDNMSVFLQGLVTLWTHDRHRRCQKLSVDLPIDGPGLFTVTHPVTPLLPQHLEAVAWKGHHNQFKLFFSQQLPPSLRTLILRCKVSLDDCERLLYSGRNSLRKFDVHYIGRGVEDVLEGQIEFTPSMNCLKSIRLAADWDIFRLFEYFHYPKLRELHITNTKPRLSPQKTQFEVNRYFANIPRSELTSTQLYCAMTQEEKDWLDRSRGQNDIGYMTEDISNTDHDHDNFPALPSIL
ncbi:hypothetical protein C0989_005526 [Termitomyces sp. Mn162]|nr:hypothetical protein C0989_005526 [Termitomyces sp. Mn162]